MLTALLGASISSLTPQVSSTDCCYPRPNAAIARDNADRDPIQCGARQLRVPRASQSHAQGRRQGPDAHTRKSLTSGHENMYSWSFASCCARLEALYAFGWPIEIAVQPSKPVPTPSAIWIELQGALQEFVRCLELPNDGMRDAEHRQRKGIIGRERHGVVRAAGGRSRTPPRRVRCWRLLDRLLRRLPRRRRLLPFADNCRGRLHPSAAPLSLSRLSIGEPP